MVLPWLPLALALLLSAAHLFAERFSRAEKYHQGFLSLASGMLVALLLLEIMPLLFASPYATDIPFAMLAGFSLYHFLERHVYRHHRKAQMSAELAKLHLAGFFLDGIVIGSILLLIASVSAIPVIFIIFVPLLLGASSSSVAIKHIHDSFRIDAMSRLMLSGSYVAGAFLASSVNLQGEPFYLVMSFLAGILLYFVVRDELPKSRNGNSWVFLFGVLSIASLMLLGRGF
ncbi:MAG: hypothetical protein HYY37_00575 [Candidatus Aenigmarchaeota archaeon]|nr:hypothetical protein [Candidatus Aenigmarchaeota archaeon]